MKRLRGWEQRLAAATTAALRRPYAWGSHDCALFAADCVLAVTGEDFAAEFRGQYDTDQSARRLLAQLGCEDVGDLAGRFLPEIEPRDARRGDVVMMPGKMGAFLAIVDGRTAVGPVSRGLAHVPMSVAVRAWRVG